MIIIFTINNSAVINNILWKSPGPYFELQNSHGHAKGFFFFFEIYRQFEPVRQVAVWSPEAFLVL